MNEIPQSPNNGQTYLITPDGELILRPQIPSHMNGLTSYFIMCAEPCGRDPKYVQTIVDFYEDYELYCGIINNYELVSLELLLEYADKYGFIREYSSERGCEIIYANLNPNPSVIDEDEEYRDLDAECYYF